MRRHDFDPVSFTLGLLFAAVGLVLLGDGAVQDGLALPWAGPIVAIGLGLLVVIAARPRGTRPDAEDLTAGPEDAVAPES